MSPHDPPPVAHVLVMGGGSAGLMTAITLKHRIPALRVQVLRSKDIGVIGVGEGTTAAVPRFLHGYLGLDPARFLAEAKPTFKLGIRFLWGTRPWFDYTFGRQTDWKWRELPRQNAYYCARDMTCCDLASALMAEGRAFARTESGRPFVSREELAYHVENEAFVDFLERHATATGVELEDETVESVAQDGSGVTSLRAASGRTYAADLYVDCSGFRSALLGRTLGEPFVSYKDTLFCDRAVVGGRARDAGEPVKPYTTAETMPAGWCWQIEHESRVNRGYVYSSAFTSDDEAEREFRARNPKVESTRVVRFIPGRYERSWVKNVVAIGNASGFVEPLEATSLAVIANECRLLAGLLAECERRPAPVTAAAYNRLSARSWDSVRNFLGIHYRFNDRLDTPFWRACRADVDIDATGELVEYYRAHGPAGFARNAFLDPNDMFGLEGYLTLLIGQRVPFGGGDQPLGAEELRAWDEIRQRHRRAARAGFTVAEALAQMRSASWRWDPETYDMSAPPPRPRLVQLDPRSG